jgi:hypothetical protein
MVQWQNSLLLGGVSILIKFIKEIIKDYGPIEWSLVVAILVVLVILV